MAINAATKLADMMQVKRLCATASMPMRGSVHAAGFDLAASEAIAVPARGKAIVKTGLSIAIPKGTYARVAPRSGLAAKKMIHTGAGVVDYDYRGEVGVVLFNHGPEEFKVAVGDRVAQLILEKVVMAGCEEVKQLSDTARGAGGFGSTGVEGQVAGVTAGVTPVPTSEAPNDGEQSEVQVLKRESAQLRSEVEAIRALVGLGSRLVAPMQAKRLTDKAVLPSRGSEHAAGFDLAAAQGATVPAGGKAIVKTGWAIAIPEGTYARIAPRSGLAAKKMIDVGAGVVDYDYRGEVGVVLFNHGAEDFAVAEGDRIAQLILEEVSMASCVEVESLGDTVRGAGGFGSTGVEGEVQDPLLKKPRISDVSAGTAPAAEKQEDMRSELQQLRAELEALRAQVKAAIGAPTFADVMTVPEAQ